MGFTRLSRKVRRLIGQARPRDGHRRKFAGVQTFLYVFTTALRGRARHPPRRLCRFGSRRYNGSEPSRAPAVQPIRVARADRGSRRTCVLDVHRAVVDETIERAA